MGLHIRTALARRRTRRRAGKKHIYWPLVLLLVLLLALPVTMLSLRPQLTEYAVNYVQYQATEIIEQSVAECVADMEEMGQIQTDENGSVTSLTTNTAAVNRLRTQVVQQVYDNINTMETAHTSVAIGTLIDPQYLAGIGPQLSFGVTALGRVKANVDSEFTAAGINQTIYHLTICVTADFSIRTMGKAQTVTVSAEYPLEETIIVGEVPMIASNS